MNKEWGTPISKDKIIFRRNKLVEWQKIGELRFTPLYEIIDENILDINYMIYEIERLNNIIKTFEAYLDTVLYTYKKDELSEARAQLELAKDKLKELKEGR